MITPKELIALAKAMRSSGVVSLKTPEIELLVEPKQVIKRTRRAKSAISEEPLINDFKGYNDEQILAWSAPSEG